MYGTDVTYKKYDKREPKKKGKRLKQSTINKIALADVRKKPLIVTGSRAMNIQIKPQYRRKSSDVDMWAKNPEYHMDRMEDVLDKHAGGDRYKERVLIMNDALTGQKKVYQVVDNKTNKSVLDYTKRTPYARTTKINKIKYEHISHIEKKFKAILADPHTTPARRKKVKSDLKRIQRSKK